MKRNHDELLSCSTERGISTLKKTGNFDFRPLLFLQVLQTIKRNIGDRLHEKTVYNINKLYDEVMFKYGTICKTPIPQTFVYGKDKCNSPIYIPENINNTGPTISDPPILEL